jgi:intergrase/recombinase
MYVSNLQAFRISKMLILKVKVEIIDFYTGNAPPHQALPYIYRT